MAAQDKKSVIRELIELGKSKGQLTTKEILDALGELNFTIRLNRTASRSSRISATSRSTTWI